MMYVFFGLAIASVIILGMSMRLVAYRRQITSITKPPSEVTTHLPYPLGATTCSHEWQEVKSAVLENAQEKKFIYIQQCPLCGLVDKTIENIKSIPLKSECRHNWMKQSVELESAYEQITKNGEYYEGKMSPWAFLKTVAITRICTKCGEINTVMVANYALDDIPEAMWKK